MPRPWRITRWLSLLGLPVTALKAHGKGVGVAKPVAAELCSRYCSVSQRAGGHALGCPGNGAVGKQRLRLKRKLADDSTLERRIERIQAKLMALTSSVAVCPAEPTLLSRARSV